jgi:peptide/nickel transport system ATP-binding protein
VAEPLLRVSGLSVAYQTAAGRVEAVTDFGLELQPGELLGLVGESGCGKSTAVMGMFRLLPPPAVVTAGEVWFQGRDVLGMGEEELRRLRWREVSLVPQSALNALNPVLRVGEQVVDTLQSHGAISAEAALARGAELLALVGIDAVHLHSYPHALSGGMRQRVALALALAMSPPLVLMDEPTTALDVVVEREILARLLALQERLGFAVIFITHDLALLLELATRIGVLYSGSLVELAPVAALRSGGRHPYTRALLAAMPQAFGEAQPVSLAGAPPRLADAPGGCRFAPRCPLVTERCRAEAPPLRSLSDDHSVACHEVR